MTIPDPTSEQCSTNATLDLGDGRTGVAAWYPQMGGYVSHCVIVAEPGGCCDVYVWHDGDFPFGEDLDGELGKPREMHHCDGDQFIRFGKLLVKLQDAQLDAEEAGMSDDEVIITREDLTSHIDDPVCTCVRCHPEWHTGVRCNCLHCVSLVAAATKGRKTA